MFSNSFMWFIFNLQRRKIYTVLYNIIQWTTLNVWEFQMQKPLHGVQTSLRSNPVLWFNCPISHKLLALPHISTHVIQFETARRRHEHIRNLLGPIHVLFHSHFPSFSSSPWLLSFTKRVSYIHPSVPLNLPNRQYSFFMV
jgi:hypothetical protein